MQAWRLHRSRAHRNAPGRAGVADWQTLVKAIFDWIAKARDDERWRRIGLVADLVREIEPHVARMAKLRAPRKQKQIDAAGLKVHRLLKDFADNLAMPK